MVTFDEFCKMMQSRVKREDDEITQLREAFDVFDENGDGYVDVEDLRLVLQTCGDNRLTDEDFEEMIKQADIYEKGKVSFEGEKCSFLILDYILYFILDVETYDVISLA